MKLKSIGKLLNINFYIQPKHYLDRPNVAIKKNLFKLRPIPEVKYNIKVNVRTTIRKHVDKSQTTSAFNAKRKERNQFTE